jgi:predicted TIM-barrel fold metal-dependent hydrolase
VPRVSIVSADGHAVMPTDRWPEYLEHRFHEHLPRLRADDAINERSMLPLNDALMVPAMEVFDTEGVYRAEQWRGAWDAEVRLQELDREGVAAELVYHGFFRTADLGFSVMNDTYPHDVIDAGARAHNRWAHDTFGGMSDRFLLVGAMGAATDLDATVAEIDWIAEHGFVGTYAPGFLGVPGLPPLDDAYWDPFWAACVDGDITLVVHAGYGMAQGYAFDQIRDAIQKVDAVGGSDMDLVVALASGLFSSQFFADLGHRQAMWQIMYGGVFDRHPGLKLLMTEVRADWLPETLARLDAAYDERRADIPSKRKPSEWWESNCLAGVSFMHKAEVEIRDEIGVESMCFGRDYPHAEGTWPNTYDYLRDLFAGVPERDTRKILGENAIRFFGLDASEIAAIAERVGPTIEEITGDAPGVDPALISHFADRTGYLKPAERGTRLDEIEGQLQHDIDRLASATPR